MKKRFIVKRVVSDYGVFDTLMPEGNQLDCICSGRRNAEIIADILNVDYLKPNECTYWKDQQIAELQENQTQKAVECLKEVKTILEKEIFWDEQEQELCDYIDNKIKELED